jgi:hypothetical protein
LPMPRLAPVTMAVLPLRSMGFTKKNIYLRDID